jgi:hypothetical protein
VWGLDHAEGSNDFLEHVRQLRRHVSVPGGSEAQEARLRVLTRLMAITAA